MTNSLAITIGDFAVRQLDGLFSLNDLHVASGGNPTHRPGEFLRIDQTKALIAELSCGNSRSLSSTDSRNLQNSADLQSVADSQVIRTVIGKGKAQGTYACRELVIAYAAWISAAFHLKVIRVFLAAINTPQVPIHGEKIPAATKLQQITHDGHIVATLAMIDSVHQRPQDTSRRTFNSNKDKFVEGKDYFKISASESLELGLNAPFGLTLLTESGYLLLIKSFKSPTAGAKSNVKQQMVSEYFRATHHTDHPTVYIPSIKNRRWLISFDHNGKELVQPVPHEAMLVTWDDVVHMVQDHSLMLTNSQLANLAKAATNRIAQRMQYTAITA